MTHVTKEDLACWRRGEMVGDSVLAIGRHLAQCRQCAALAAGEVRLGESSRAVAGQIVLDIEHPDLETDLFAYADGRLPAERRAWVDEHLPDCARCREDLAGLRGLAPSRPQGSRGWMLALAASITLVVIAAGIFRPDRPEAPRRAEQTPVVRSAPPIPAPRQPYGRTEWNEVVEGVRGGTPLAIPHVLGKIRRKPDVLRGDAAPAGAHLEPTGVVLMTTRPVFTWTAPENALSIVTIFEDEREAARSATLTATRWAPPRELTRGVTYTWQVDVEIDGETQILPMPPAPPARFHVADAATVAELEEARRQHPGDHLLLGILHARAGFDGEARAELARVRDPRDAAVAESLRREIEGWP